MLLLSADTSGREGRIALAHGKAEGACEILSVASLETQAFSANLVPQIAALLAQNQLDKTDISAFVVVSGPGSFTGLRVGLAAVKALAEVFLKPIAPVSLLEALALAAATQGRVIAAIDSSRQQIYIGVYEVSLQGARRVEEQLLTRDEFGMVASGAHVVTSHSEIAALAQAAGGVVSVVPAPDIGAIVRIGWSKILAGKTVLPEDLEADYLKHPDADIFSKMVAQ